MSKRMGMTSRLVAAAFLLVCSGLQGAEVAPEGWSLTWSDEFSGQQIDPAKWDFDLTNGFYNRHTKQWVAGWGNNEHQYYTRNPANAFVQAGALHIRALRETHKGHSFTSARLKSRTNDGAPLFCQKYGRFEFRAKVSGSKGTWPALWLLPQDEHYGGWAASGEIDVMEAKGHEPQKVHGTLHYGGRWPLNVHRGNEHILSGGGTIVDYHTYAVEWEPGEIRWFVDNVRYATQSFWWSSSKLEGGKAASPKNNTELNPWPAPFDQRFYLIMNLAVGGNFAGPPDEGSTFPAEMVVDYVRVYEKIGGYGEVKPRAAGQLPFGR
jgi:beta-glucanase (GH16 family)